MPLGDEIKPLTWSSAPPGLHEYLEGKRAALEIWREGSRRRDAVYHQPGRLSIGSEMHLIQDANVFAAMAALEGSRLEEAGARDEAWDWYLAMLRCSRLIGRHGPLVQRLFGARIHALAARLHPPMGGRPASGSRTAPPGTARHSGCRCPDPTSLRGDQARLSVVPQHRGGYDELRVDDARLWPAFSPCSGAGNGPAGSARALPAVRFSVQRFRLRASNDQERSRCAIRLLIANWLAQADRPAGRRARLAIRKPTWIYADDPSAPAAARAVMPELLAKALDRYRDRRVLVWPGSRPGRPSLGGRR